MTHKQIAALFPHTCARPLQWCRICRWVRDRRRSITNHAPVAQSRAPADVASVGHTVAPVKPVDGGPASHPGAPPLLPVHSSLQERDHGATVLRAKHYKPRALPPPTLRPPHLFFDCPRRT